ncbi:Molybdopterin biosynthesis protein [Candidatus Terasakiella magnetica]|uniref:Molybdopterin molybdenumtransferase n=1 Tax=Candidatus Terasakiella magnetica TaxID=1867952 RepID=A0A1C3RM99_9PROT|nr:gephyrin-like molybdotransferase Glp [Candidatus Terasakiella magnetica]SCA58249.1 Molybdopterin biosynthesis protein [Candidatus Terasakiella magnetica]
MNTVFESCFATPGAMMPLDEARQCLAEKIKPMAKTTTLPLRQCVGKILASDITAQQNVPPHNNSAMDGYAVKFQDLKTDGETILPVSARIAAGHPLGRRAQSGEALRIFTGAPIPEGSDTVIMQENATEAEGHVTFAPGAAPKKGANFRKLGEDIKIGDVILKKGRKLRAADIGVCASVGKTEIEVYAPLKIAVFSTGDEITDAGEPLGEGCVYDINRYSVMSLLESVGCEVTDLGILPDDLGVITNGLKEAADTHDVLFTSGGVSLGEEDHVKSAVAQLGQINFWRIAIKPGRPIALGEVGETPFIGLPGNPVATLVTFMMIARPMISGFSGRSDISTRSYKIPANFEMNHKGGRYEWQRAFLKDTPNGPVVELFHTTGSGVLTSMVQTDGLVEIPDHAHQIKVGDLVDFIPYSEVSQ